MDSTEDILKSIVNDYKEIGSATDQWAKCAKIRKSICWIIQQHLVDPYKIVSELKKAREQSSQTQTVLNFIYYLIDEFPHIVFVPSNEQCTDITDNKQDYMLEYYDFLNLLISRLIQLTAIPDLSPIHDAASKVIMLWLQLIKSKNVKVYEKVLCSLISLLNELNQIQHHYLDKDDVEEVLNSFSVKKLSLNNIPLLKISSFMNLENWQFACSDLLKVYVVDVAVFAFDKINIMWEISLDQLNIGLLPLKIISMKLIMSLLKHTFSMTQKVLQSLKFCVSALIEYTSCGRKKVPYTDAGISVKDCDNYDEALTEFLNCLFGVDYHSSGKTSLFSLPSLKIEFDFFYICSLAQLLADNLGSNMDFDKVNVLACRLVVLSALKICITNKLAVSSFLITCCCRHLSWLLEMCSHEQHSSLISEVLTYYITLLGYAEKASFVSNTADVDLTANAKRSNSLLSLSRKRRLHDLDNNIEANIMSSEVHKVHRNLLAKQGNFTEKLKTCSLKVEESLPTLNQHLSVLLCIFEPLLKACVLTKDGVNYYEVFAKLYTDGRFSESFMICVENFFDIAAEMQKISLPSGMNLIFKVYSKMIQLCRVFCLWFHFFAEELHIQLSVESSNILALLVALCSVMWVEDYPLQDLKFYDISFISHKSMLAVCQMLRNANLSVQDLTFSDTEKMMIFKNCFAVLVLLPNHMCISWRISIVVNWGLSCKCQEIERTSLSFFPLLCGHVKKTNLNFIVNYLSLYIKSINDGLCDLAVLKHLIDLITPLTLVLCGRFSLSTILFNECYDESALLELKTMITESNSVAKESLFDDTNVKLNLFSEIESIAFLSLNSVDDCHHDYKWQGLCKNLSSGVAKVLQFACAENSTGQCLLQQWIKYFDWNVNFDIVNLEFLKFVEEDTSYHLFFMNYVEEFLQKSLEAKQSRTSCNILNLIGNVIVRFVSQDKSNHVITLKSLQILCKVLPLFPTQVSSTSYLQLDKISIRKHTVLKSFRKQICASIVEGILSDQFNTRPSLDVMVDVAQLLDISLENFIAENSQYLLPPVVVISPLASSTKQDDLLSLFSQTLNKSKADIIIQNFKHVFCHAVVTGFDLEALFKFLEAQARIKQESLILINYGSLIQHLVAHLSANNDRVCKALQFIHEITSNDKKALPVSELLKPHFLSVLTFFNGQLRMSGITLADKKQVFESLICLLYLMESSDVTSVSVKIVNSLCLAQQVFISSEWADICCKAWHALVCCVDDSCLGGLLSQVAVMLLPFLEKYSSKVAGTLEYLVIERKQHTKANFCELYFLPDHDSLKSVKSCIETELKAKTSNQNNFISILEQATKQLLHDSAEVRVCALARLRTILQTNQICLQRHCFSGGNISEFIKRLASTLLSGCRDSNPQVRLLSVKCLGEVGALDPDKLLLTTNAEKPKCQFSVSFDDHDFAFDLFNRLVQAFLLAKPIHQDISAFAIQELLKIYECKEGSRDTPGRRLWRKFSPQTQSVLEPHLSSRYMLKKSEINLSNMKRPILHKRQNMMFREWIGTFCSVLMQLASFSVDETSKVRGVFEACAAVVRNDVNVALFLLPPTVVEVLKCGDHHAGFIEEEIKAVLESTEILKDTRNDQKATNYLSPPSGSNINNIDSETNKEVCSSTVTSHLSQLSAQAIFTVLDHLTLWERQPLPTSGGALARNKHVREKELAKTFLAKIPQKLLAVASLRCRAHTRALLHYETHLRESCGGVCDAESAAFLQRVFIEINETDGVLGVVNVRGVEPTPKTQLLVLESTGALQDAAACYERILRLSPDDLSHHKGFFKCLTDLGQLSTVINVIDGTIANNPNWENELNSYRIEACWRLGRWDVLEKNLTKEKSIGTNWSSGLAEAILAVKGQRWDKLDGLLDKLYQNETGPLSAASMENNSFQRGYDHILRLHMLSDLERFASGIRDHSRPCSADDLMSLWQQRLQVVQSSFKAREPMTSLCRVMLPLRFGDTDSECNRHVGKLWLQSSKLARKCGHLQTAYGALLSAQSYALPGCCIEHAKWLWKKGESHQALLTLRRGFMEHFSNDSSSNDVEQRKNRAKVMLLEAKLMEESSSFDSNTVLRKYKEVVTYMGELEESHFYCGRYYDKLMTTMIGESRVTAKAHHLYYIMHHYGRSLCYGTSHIYESLTKLLTLWLDYGATAARLEKAGKPQSNEDVQRLVEVIADVRSRLPAYIFYVAFSQLTSRICHQHEPTYNQLKEILVSVIQAFPQRALWSMMAILKSSFKQRAARCREIFDRVEYKNGNLSKLVSDAIKLTNRLIELCNKQVNSIQPLSINKDFKALKKLVESAAFSEIMLPLQRLMNVTLPQTKSNSVISSQTTHNPFPEAVLHIVGFEDLVEILPSLQRPKKISIRASDGSCCTFLCKPKDDLRKDARLTEFAAIVNKCLKRDAESGRRQLQIRTYAVIPLNEECGLIEWVNNMKGLRNILLPIYKARGLYCSGKQLKSWQLPVSETLQKKLEVYRTKLLPRHPAVFHEWFLTTFNDPSAWYNARLAYARSVAVMSMVGYILGLGDRHGENILFDSNSGEAMHVDFNCLFNKGMSLEVPEIVPFRLTHNMVDAMGPTKYEGFFRRACEVTMNVLREQREPLMSVLKTFIHDPLVEWSKKGRGISGAAAGEALSEKALTHVNDIDKRLRGIAGKNKGLPLSIEGHVHYLIQEATDEEKLCQMYVGWAPFM